MSIVLTDSTGNTIGNVDADFSSEDFEPDDFVTDEYNLDIVFTKVSESLSNRNVIMYYPSGSVNPNCHSIQNLCNKNRIFNIDGKILLLDSTTGAQTREYFRDTILGSTGSIYGTYIDNTTIFYNSISFYDDEKEPLVIGFNFELIEII